MNHVNFLSTEGVIPKGYGDMREPTELGSGGMLWIDDLCPSGAGGAVVINVTYVINYYEYYFHNN